MTNVLLLVLDSVRARNASCYDYPLETTPFLDAFAEEATLYQQARAPGADSIVSHASMFTGLHPQEHGVISSDISLTEGTSIWEKLQQQDYATGAFTANPFFSDLPVGLTHGFDYVETGTDEQLPFPSAVDPREYPRQPREFVLDAFKHHSPIRTAINGLTFKLRDGFEEPPADVFVDSFLNWEDQQDTPWGAVINFMDAHDPYLPDTQHEMWGGEEARELQRTIDEMIWEFVGGDRPWWQRATLEALYDGAIRQVDAAIHELTTALKERKVYDDTLIVVCGDHGEGFGEESRIRRGARVSQHTIGIHESLVHVPLLVKHPRQESGKVVSDLATLTQFADVTASWVDSDRSPADFVPDGPVLSTSIGAEKRAPVKVREYCDDPERYTGDITAVYREREGEVVKEIEWESERATVVVEDVRTSYRREDDISDDAVEFVASLEDAGVATRAERTVTEGALDRLQKLGYR